MLAGRHWRCGVASATAAVVATAVAEETISWGGVQLSPHEEFRNQEVMQQALFQRFYFSAELDTQWHSVEGDLRALKDVALSGVPALAVAVATSLYHFFFFHEALDEPPALRTDTMLDALQLFNLSLGFSACLSPDTDLRDFLLGMCTTKFGFVQLLAAELGAAYAVNYDWEPSFLVLSFAAGLFHQMAALPYFQHGVRWASPLNIAFNDELYPDHFGAVWPKDVVPLAKFLEEHFETFRHDLDSILAEDDLFNRLRNLERNAEGLSVWPPGARKHIELADMREPDGWKPALCAYANASCSLLRQRPEITDCPRAAVMIARLSPGAWLKPHFGNSRRLVAHLGLIVPEGPIVLNVGPARGLKWQEGRALVFDDTHAHDARHAGVEGTRYILHMMICHPCEQQHLYPHLAPEVSRALRAEMDAKEAAMRVAERMVIPRSAPEDV